MWASNKYYLMMTMSSWRQLCSAESLHYTWPNFLLLSSRNAPVSSTETSEISIWGEVPLPTSLMKGVINPHPFFLWLLPNWPSEGPSLQAAWFSAVPCVPSRAIFCEFSGPTPKAQTAECSLPQPQQKEKQNQVLTGFSPWLIWNEPTALVSQRGFKLFWDACIKNSVMY